MPATPPTQGLSDLLLKKVGAEALPRRCAKGDFVFREGERYQGPWILEKGVAVILKVSSAGKEQIIRQIEPMEMFAEIPLFLPADKYPINVRCATPCDLVLLPAGKVRRALQKDPSLSWTAACALAERIAHFRDSLLDLTLAEAKQRLLRYLLRRLETMPNAGFGVVRLGLSLQDLALLLGIRPESLSRALADLESSGKLKKLSRQTFQVFLKNIRQEDREL